MKDKNGEQYIIMADGKRMYITNFTHGPIRPEDMPGIAHALYPNEYPCPRCGELGPHDYETCPRRSP